MTAGLGGGRLVALLPGLIAILPAAGVAHAACLALVAHPDGAPLAVLAVATGDPSFTVTYVHSVTRTPVDERYRVDGATIVQTEIRFDQHGPGLPTQADAGAQWSRRDGRYVVTMERRFERVVMRVHADQKPALVAGARSVDLAQWGNRAIAVDIASDRCGSP